MVSALASPPSPSLRKRCPETHITSSARRALDDEINARAAPAPRNGVQHVQVVVHVVSAPGAPHFTVSDSLIGKQLSVLDKDFAAAGFGFDLKAVERTQLSTLPKTADELDALKSKLHRGNAATLNLYLMPELKLDKTDLLGISSFPWKLAKHPKADGVSVLATTMPGGSTDTYSNGGRTATHEIGHWLGLWHTFQGGCKDSDHVSDTPAMAAPARVPRPPETTDSCRRKPGNDPVHNPMNYIADDWVREFTPQQIERMNKAWDKYRGG